VTEQERADQFFTYAYVIFCSLLIFAAAFKLYLESSEQSITET